MFGRYALSCERCEIEYVFKRKKKLREFGRECPGCGERLSPLPLMRYVITPPPELEVLPRTVEEIEIY